MIQFTSFRELIEEPFEAEPAQLLFECVLDNFVPSSYQQFIVIVENHSKCRAVDLDHREKSTVSIEDLNSLDVANKDSALAIDGN